jgi:hypothetical protein
MVASEYSIADRRLSDAGMRSSRSWTLRYWPLGRTLRSPMFPLQLAVPTQTGRSAVTGTRDLPATSVRVASVPLISGYKGPGTKAVRTAFVTVAARSRADWHQTRAVSLCIRHAAPPAKMASQMTALATHATCTPPPRNGACTR